MFLFAILISRHLVFTTKVSSKLYLKMMKFTFVLILTLIAIVTTRPSCPGCVTYLTGDRLNEAESTLENSLSKLAAKDGPYFRLVKVNSATTQVVAGIKHVIIADLIDDDDKRKSCKITIWSQPWMPNGTEVRFDCPGEEKIIKRHGS